MTDLAATDGVRHTAFFYASLADYSAQISRFVAAGLSRHEPVLIAVPRASWVLPDWPAEVAGQVAVTDMAELGRNPARIIPALRAFGTRYLGNRTRIVTESVWPGRSPAEMCEAARCEALVDRALDGFQATVVCAYNATELPASTLDDAARSHQWLLGPDEVVVSRDYSASEASPAASREPLSSPPEGAQTIAYGNDLRPIRAMVSAACEQAGLPVMRATDLTLAVSEVAANTIRHTTAGGVIHTWQAGGELVCQVSDTGRITDPLAGVIRPAADQLGGHGLWLVNQVCDLVEIRTGETGTVVRLHMRIAN